MSDGSPGLLKGCSPLWPQGQASEGSGLRRAVDAQVVFKKEPDIRHSREGTDMAISAVASVAEGEHDVKPRREVWQA